MRVLITGGAGYIGSHATRKFLDAGHDVIVLDNLSKGHREAVDARAKFIEGDVADSELIEHTLRENAIEAILHFAAYIEVGESVEHPLEYYQNNTISAHALITSAKNAGVKRFVFSSTAAVYGMPEKTPIEETALLAPINPYGRSKMMVEMMLEDSCRAYGIGYCALRYFNVAGAHPSAQIGEDHDPESHLIPRILKAALNDSAKASIFGTDYPTPDGTCVRDYIHVEDLVEAHRLALEAIQPGEARVYNLGSENGFSVREVIKACEKVIGRAIPVAEQGRRPGDPPALIASSRKIIAELGWEKRYPDLETMIAHAWHWHSTHPEGYATEEPSDMARQQASVATASAAH